MRKKMAILKTVLAMRTAYNDLINRDPGVAGLMLVTGESGAGKSETVAWLCEEVDGVYVRALSCDTTVTLLHRIMQGLGLESASYLGNGLAAEKIAAYLAKTRRALFVDECDNLFNSPRLLETLRDIHDLYGTPIVLIGHAGVERRMANRQQLYRRITQWVTFLPIDSEDASILARTICEVEIAADLLEHVHNETRGNPGLMTVALSRIEAFAKANKLRSVNVEKWNNQRLFVNPKSRAAAA